MKLNVFDGRFGFRFRFRFKLEEGLFILVTGSDSEGGCEGEGEDMGIYGGFTGNISIVREFFIEVMCSSFLVVAHLWTHI